MPASTPGKHGADSIPWTATLPAVSDWAPRQSFASLG